MLSLLYSSLNKARFKSIPICTIYYWCQQALGRLHRSHQKHKLWTIEYFPHCHLSIARPSLPTRAPANPVLPCPCLSRLICLLANWISASPRAETPRRGQSVPQFLGLRGAEQPQIYCGSVSACPSLPDFKTLTVDSEWCRFNSGGNVLSGLRKKRCLMSPPNIACSIFQLPRSKEPSLCREIWSKLLAIPSGNLQHILLLTPGLS